MKYQVIYLKPKKKAYSKQTAVFYTIEDATHWEKYIKSQGCQNTEIIPVLQCFNLNLIKKGIKKYKCVCCNILNKMNIIENQLSIIVENRINVEDYKSYKCL